MISMNRKENFIRTQEASVEVRSNPQRALSEEPKATFFIILAISYFPRGPPLKYRHSLYVSHISSRWISVVPYKQKHQKKRCSNSRSNAAF